MGNIRYPYKSMKLLEDLDDRLSGNNRLWDKIDRLLHRGPNYKEEDKEAFEEEILFLRRLFEIQRKYDKEAGPYNDMLGEYLEYNEETNASTGQFFTPMSICHLVLRMTLNPEEYKNSETVQAISDPAAGSGRFMLAAADKIKKATGQLCLYFHNIDIDYRAWILCSMNAILHKIPSINIWGDTLAMKLHKAIVVIPENGVPVWKFASESGMNWLRGIVEENKDELKQQLEQRKMAVAQQDLFAGLLDSEKGVAV